MRVRAQAAIGWWCFIDAAIYNSMDTTINSDACKGAPPKDLGFAMWLPGIGATLGIVMINCFNYSAYTNTGDGNAAACNNAWLFFSYLIMFGCIIASTWIMVEYWLASDSCTHWPGIAGVVQTVSLLLSGTVFFVGREAGGSRPSVGGTF